MPFILCACLAVNLEPTSLACVNTSYSTIEEKEITNDLRLLVIGAFPAHGDAFFENELKRCRSILKSEPKNFDARNDLAAAMMKLGRFEDAEHQLLENEKIHPAQYRTASNLGVLYKKWSRFDLSKKWLETALQIQPEGHMGLGDYYLRMVQWRGNTNKKETNFLGVASHLDARATAAVANREYVITLIKNDRHFANAYVVLGDIAFVEGDLQTAVRCYLRAEELGDESNGLDVRRKNAIEQLSWMPNVAFDMKKGVASIRNEFQAAKKWLNVYQSRESDRIDQGLAVDFASMRDSAPELPVVTAHELVTTTIPQSVFANPKLMWPLTIAVVGLLLWWLKRQSMLIRQSASC